MAGDNAPKNAIILYQEGDIGTFDRATRTLTHFLENSYAAPFAIGILSFVYPVPVFVITCIFAFFRVAYSSMYTHGGYAQRLIGFFGSSFAMSTLQGMLLQVAILGFMKKNEFSV